MSDFLPRFTFEDVPDHWEIPEKFKDGWVLAVNAQNGFLSVLVPAHKEGCYIIEEQYAEYLFSSSGKPFAILDHTGLKSVVKAGDLKTTYTFYGNMDYPSSKYALRVEGNFDICIESESGGESVNVDVPVPDDLIDTSGISALVDYQNELICGLELGRCFSAKTTDGQIFAPSIGAAWYHNGWLPDDQFKILDLRNLNYYPQGKYRRLDIFAPAGMILAPLDLSDCLDNRLFLAKYTYKGNELSLSQHSLEDKIVKTLTAPKKLDMKPIIECMFDRPTQFEMLAPNFVPKWVDIGKHTGLKLSYEFCDPDNYQE
ncbi:MAG: hypothetical protein WCV81_04350 [Microgenomates group bacterium]|jgi:hypothetical protein